MLAEHQVPGLTCRLQLFSSKTATEEPTSKTGMDRMARESHVIFSLLKILRQEAHHDTIRYSLYLENDLIDNFDT